MDNRILLKYASPLLAQELGGEKSPLLDTLNTTEIQIFSPNSVMKYKENVVRWGLIRFILNPRRCEFLLILYFLMPVLFTCMFLVGWLSGWQSISLTALFQLPSTYDLL
jgi:hypothetical protein